jgi:flagellar biosynthesis protein FlhF
MRARLKTNSELGGGASAVVALVGPSGAGKTTAVAKLAFRCGLLRRRRVRLFSVDQLRIGAVEPLQAYAELMNTPLQVVDDFNKLGQELARPSPGEGGRPELVLIDTPGYGRREWERARRLAAAFLARGGVDVHLVLDLRTKNEDLRRTVERFGVFRPAKLLFTRLDETTTFGTMLNETVRSGLPLSFVSVGQRVPEDLVPAGEPELLKLLLRNRSTS